MVVLLPAKVDGLPAVEKSFTPENYDSWIAKLKSVNVQVWLPKFKATQEFRIEQQLSAMGMPLAFSPSGADFSGMDGKHDLSSRR